MASTMSPGRRRKGGGEEGMEGGKQGGERKEKSRKGGQVRGDKVTIEGIVKTMLVCLEQH